MELDSTAVMVLGAVLAGADAATTERWPLPDAAGGALGGAGLAFDAELVELGGAAVGRAGLLGGGCVDLDLLAAVFPLF
jgi:hypothetical protein